MRSSWAPSPERWGWYTGGCCSLGTSWDGVNTKPARSFFLLNCALRFPGAQSSTFSLLPCTGQAMGSRMCGASEVAELLQQQVPFPGKPHRCWVCGRGSNLQPTNCNLVCGRRDLARMDRVTERSWEADLTLAPATDICRAAEMIKTPT